MITHEPCRTRGDCYHSRAGRIGGPIGGRSQPREAKSRGGRNQSREAKILGGRISGCKNAESGNLVSLGRIQGRKNAESGQIQTLGRIYGRASVENGQLARISKGVPSTADGIYFPSQTEAMFYCTMKELDGEPRAHPPRIKLPDGRSYFPDFILGRSVLSIPANVPIEIKPARRKTFYQTNLLKAIEAGAFVVYWDELVE